MILRRRRLRLPWHMLWLGALLIMASAAGAADWRGFRGLGQQGCSASAKAPRHWSPTQHVRWRTPLPGEGHSSPIVVGDAVYVSYAEPRPLPARLPATVHLILMVLAWCLLAALLWTVAARSRGPLSPGGLPSFAAMVGLAMAMALLVVVGESVLASGQGRERAWLAALLSLVLALVITVSAGGTRTAEEGRPLRRPGWAAAGLSALAVAAYLLIPDRALPFDGGPLQPGSLLILGVVVLPACMALMIGAALLRRRHPSLAMALGLPGVLLAFSGVAVLALAVQRAQTSTRGVVGISQPYLPHTHWWLPALVVALAVGLLCLRWVRPRSALVNVLGVLGLVAATLLTLGCGLDRLAARVPYLAYTLGNPYYGPLLAPWVTLLLSGAVTLALAASALGVRYRHDPAPTSLEAIPALLALLLGAGSFAWALHVPSAEMCARGILCLDRATGRERWRVTGLEGPRDTMHADNSAATPTPVSDGERVFAYFGTPGIMAVDRGGKLLWTRRPIPFVSSEGVASSPIMWQGAVVVLSESQAGQWLLALDGRTGRTRWQTPRRHKMHMYAGNCRTPLVWPVRGQPTLIVWGLEDVSGYDATGREVWTHEVMGFGDSNNPVACAVADRERLYLTGPRQTVALALGKLGQPGSPVAWRTEYLDGAQCASPVLTAGLLISVTDTGTIYCADATTGRPLWSHDFGWTHYASPVAVGSRVYDSDTRGKTHVVAAARQFRLLAGNDLGEPISASVAAADGRLYVRTQKAVWCLE